MTYVIDADGNIKVTPGIHDHSTLVAGGPSLQNIEDFNFDDATILTIDGVGAVARTQVYHIIAANAGAADDLDNVTGGTEGDELIIRPDAGDTITVRHNQGGAGDIWLAGGANIVLDNQDHLRLVHDGTSWCDQSGGAGGLGDHTHSAPGDGGATLAAHTVTGNVDFDDGVGDSPQLQFIGGSNNDTGLIFLDDDGVANRSDLVIRMAGTTAFATLNIEDSGGQALASFYCSGGLALLAPGGLSSPFSVGDGLSTLTRLLTEPACRVVIGTGVTNAVKEALRIAHALTAGSAAAGFGVRQVWELVDDGANIEDAVTADAIWTDAGDGTEESILALGVMTGGAAAAEMVRVDGNGLLFALDKIIDMDELAAAPANPAANRWKIYPKSDGFYQLDDAGNEEPLTAKGVAVYNDANIPCNSGVWTWLTFNQERQDDAGFHDGVNPGRLTCPDGLSGWYTISGSVNLLNHAGGTYRQAGIRLNGATFLGLQQGTFGAGFTTNFTVTIVYHLSDNGVAANDYVELGVAHDAGVALNARTLANYSPEFRMVRV